MASSVKLPKPSSTSCVNVGYTEGMTIVENIAQLQNTNPKAVALFIKRAQIQTGADNANPFFLAGLIGRTFPGGDRDAAVLLFRSASDVGTNRARRKTGWQL